MVTRAMKYGLANVSLGNPVKLGLHQRISPVRISAVFCTNLNMITLGHFDLVGGIWRVNKGPIQCSFIAGLTFV